MHQLSSGEVVSPGERVILAKNSEVDFQFLVDTFSLSISLGVERITPFVSPWSTMTRIESYPKEGGRSVMRSQEICWNRQVAVEGSLGWC